MALESRIGSPFSGWLQHIETATNSARNPTDESGFAPTRWKGEVVPFADGPQSHDAAVPRREITLW
jgi:hypothetical protein